MECVCVTCYFRGKQARLARPWRRGTLSLIGSTHLLVVRGANSNMGTAPHDCPVARVVDDDVHGETEGSMTRVFDQLYDEYGNGVDTKSGPDQRSIFRVGLEPILAEFPKLDVLLSCAVADTRWAKEVLAQTENIAPEDEPALVPTLVPALSILPGASRPHISG